MIPTYKAARSIVEVVRSIPSYVDKVVVVDDACPENSSDILKLSNPPKKVKILVHEINQGVGGATITGYKYCLEQNYDIVIKMDSDGQMDPSKMFKLIDPIIENRADYVKGNRFFSIDSLKQMPRIRIVGNAILSLLTKISTGYWNIFDPTNGYTAISSKCLVKIPLQKLSQRYFFESDLLFRLSIIRAVVNDVDIPARYGNEISNLKIHKVILPFIWKHIANYNKRFFYNYILRDMNIATIFFPLGLVSLLIGTIRGIIAWIRSTNTNIPATAGNVVLTSFLLLAGIQFILGFINYDINITPRK